MDVYIKLITNHSTGRAIQRAPVSSNVIRRTYRGKEMKQIYTIICLLLFSNMAIANSLIENKIKEIIEINLQYTQDENIEKTMSTMHSQSPSYLPTKNVLPEVFKNYDLRYKLISYKFIAYDGDLAYVRIKQTTKKISGPAFNNNELDAVQTFRQEAGQWKLWAQMNIDIKYIK